MRNVRMTWSVRLIAAATTLALILASVVGSYGHAAGHRHNSDLRGAQAQSFDHHAASADTQPAHIDCDHHKTDTGSTHADCCDTICHGGYAILCGTCIIPSLVRPAPHIAPTASPVGTQPNSLERPPRSPVLA